MKKTKNMPKKTKFFGKTFLPKKNKQALHVIEWLFILMAFFVVGLLIAYQQTFNAFFDARGVDHSVNREALVQTPEEDKMFTGEVVPELIDTTDWDLYQNKWYGFEIKHSDKWKNNTQYRTATEKSARYETIYKFRKDEDDSNDVFEGFDVRIYPAKKVSGVENTNEIHKKEEVLEDQGECTVSAEEIKINDEISLQKISIGKDDPCFEPAYFHSIAKGDYIYNIVPAVGESGERFSEPEKETSRLFPEYKEAVASFNFIPIVRPKPKPDPRIGVKKPLSAKLVNGRLVCAKKNDKPGKSKANNKGKIHLDLECCLDPDEIPNPWCYYDPVKYGKYLK